MLSGTFCSFHRPHCILDRPLWFGTFGMAPLVAMGRADAAEAHPIGSEEGDHEGLLLLWSVACHQTRQLGLPPLAFIDREMGGHETLVSVNHRGLTVKQSSVQFNTTTRPTTRA